MACCSVCAYATLCLLFKLYSQQAHWNNNNETYSKTLFDRTQEFLKQCLLQWNDSVFGSWNTHSQRQYTPQHYTYTTTTTSTVTATYA
eukprot:19921-Heterococcus_DN1.PRE.1